MSTGVEYILRARDLLSGVLKNASNAADNVRKGVDNVNTTTQKYVKESKVSIERLTKTLEYLKERQSKAFDEKYIAKYGDSIKRVQSELSRLNKLSNIPTPKSGMWGNYISGLKNANSEASNLGGSIRNIVGAMALFQGVKAIVKMGADLEQSKISFDVLLGSAQKAKIMLDGINKFANDTPYENKGLIDNAKMMLSFGTSAEKILPNLKMLGDIAMGDANKMSSLTLAFSQMSSAGKLQGQDLLQMINAGFNPLQELQKMTGKSMGTLRKEMEGGKISASMIEKAFQHATSKGGLFFGMMDKMSQTASGKFSTLVGTLRQTGAEIGLKLLPYASSLMNFLMPMVDWIGRNSDMLLQLTGVALGAFAAFKLITWGIKMWTIAQAILNGTMALNPVGLIIIGIAALIAMIVVAWNKFAWFRGGVMGLWETFKLFVRFLKDAVVNTVKGLVDMFSGLGKIIKGIFSGNFEQVKIGARQAAAGFANSYGGLGIVKAAKENGSKIGETWAKGYNNGVKSKASGLNASSLIGGGSSLLGANTPNPTINPDDKIKSIAGGGSKPTNITINLNKEMVGSITVQSTNVTEGAGKIKDIVIEAMAQVLNSANRLATE